MSISNRNHVVAAIQTSSREVMHMEAIIGAPNTHHYGYMLLNLPQQKDYLSSFVSCYHSSHGNNHECFSPMVRVSLGYFCH